MPISDNRPGAISSSAGVVTINGLSGAVTITKSTIGLANVDNTSDANKPVSLAQQAALDAKQALLNLVAGSILFSGGGSSVLEDNTNFVWNNVSKSLKIGNKIQLGTTDPFGRYQIWNYGTNASMRLGSLAQDGDPTDVNSEGVVIYGANSQGAAINSVTGNFGYARIKADRFGLLTAINNVQNYYWRVDPTSMYLRNDAGSKTFEVIRSSGEIKVNGVTLSVGTTEIQVDCLDNATENIVIGTQDTKYVIDFMLKSNVSSKKITGTIVLAYDGSLLFDEERQFSGVDLPVTITPFNSAGNVGIDVALAALGENAKFKYSLRSITPIT